MKNRNVLMKWALPLLLFCIASPAKAQVQYGFASNNDGWISALLFPGQDYAPVTLGNTKDENCPDCQYYWEFIEGVQPLGYSDSQWPPTGIWPRLKNPVVNMPLGEALFQCTRVSIYGFQTELVKVIVDNKIKVTAKPNQCCWSNGDPITIDQFTISTDPPGFESRVALDANSQEARHFVESSETTQKINFMHVGNSGPLVNPIPVIGETEITVIESHQHHTVTIGLSRNLARAIDALEHIDKWKGSFAKAEQMMQPLKKFGPFDFDYDFGGSINIGAGEECCCGKKYDFINLNGSAFFNASFMFTATPIAVFPPLKLKFGAEGGISVALLNIKLSESRHDPDECGCSMVSTLPFNFYVNIVGGVALESPLPDMLSASGLVVGGFSADLSYIASDGFSSSGYNFYLKVRAKAVIPFATYSYEWILLD